MHTLVLLRGNHKTLVHDRTVSEVEDIIRLATRQQRQIDSVHEFVYLQPGDADAIQNRVAVDPFAVVALIAVEPLATVN